MEAIKLSICRLCAQSRNPDEITGQMHDGNLDIESKLIVCCQWKEINVGNGTHSVKMPQGVCTLCLQNLHQR